MEYLFFVIILLFSIVIHEVAHGYMALFRGDPTAKYAGRLTLNPIKHLDLIGSIIVPILTVSTGGFIFGWAKPVPYNPYNLKKPRIDEVFIALAGPASNTVIALVCGIILRLADAAILPLSAPAVNFVLAALMINVVLAVFNLIPVPPLDGSKILFSLLPYRLQKYRQQIELYSLILLIGVIFLLAEPIGYITMQVVEIISGRAL